MSNPKAGDTYWIVACSTADQPREGIYSVLRSRVEQSLVTDLAVFDIPLNLKFGSFDDLIRLTDDLPKYDSMCEQTVRRLEREALDIDPSAELRIFFQRKTLTLEQYLHRFVWDEAKYPKSRRLRDNVDLLVSSVSRIDEEVRVKASAYNEAKQSQQSANKSDTASFMQRDLIDVLTPDIVGDDDFVETEHMTTLIVVVPSGHEDVWNRSYESLASFVVPRSARKFPPVDKEGNTLWRVVLFKRSLEEFQTAAKGKRFVVRDFKYSSTAFKRKREERSRLNEEKNKQESFMSRVCLASFSDALIAWVHIKAMRVFTEAVLRFGVPPQFSAFLVKPIMSKEKRLRKELDDVFNTDGLFGRAYIEGNERKGASTTDSALATDLFGQDEGYYPYVFTSFVPFQLFTQK